jgi:hypothetical protein
MIFKIFASGRKFRSARPMKLKKALFEYNKLLKSTHVLNLIDNMSLRRHFTVRATSPHFRND